MRRVYREHVRRDCGASKQCREQHEHKQPNNQLDDKPIKAHGHLLLWHKQIPTNAPSPAPVICGTMAPGAFVYINTCSAEINETEAAKHAPLQGARLVVAVVYCVTT